MSILQRINIKFVKKSRKLRHFLFFFLMSFFVLFCVNVYSMNPDIVKYGIRTSSPFISSSKTREGITSYDGGFCIDIMKSIESKLQENLNLSQNNIRLSKPIIMQNNDKDSNKNQSKYPKSNGLNTGRVQIECGRQVLQEQLQSNSGDHVQFSEPFFETGLKIIFNKNSDNSIKVDNWYDSDPSNDSFSLQDIKIGIIRQRHHIQELLKQNGNYNPLMYDTQEELFTALDKGKINAYLDDSLCILDFFKTYIDNNSKYKNDFLIYPVNQKEFLFSSDKDQDDKVYYVFAFSNENNSVAYKEAVDSILKNKKYTTKILNFENIEKELERQAEEQNKYIGLIRFCDSVYSLVIKPMPMRFILFLLLIVLPTIAINYVAIKKGENWNTPDWLGVVGFVLTIVLPVIS